MVEHWGHNPSVVGSIPIIVTIINKMKEQIKYKDKNKLNKYFIYNYLVDSRKGEYELASHIYRKGLFSPISLIGGLSYLDKSSLPLFKYKYVSNILGKYVYVVVKQLKLYSIFLFIVRKLMNKESYQYRSASEEDVLHYRTKKLLYIKYRYNIYLWYKWWYRKKYKKHRSKLWREFYKVPNTFWGNIIKKRVKSFIFKVLNKLRNGETSWKNKLYLKSYDEIVKSLYYYILYRKRKKIKKIRIVKLNAPSKNISDKIINLREKIRKLMYYPEIVDKINDSNTLDVWISFNNEIEKNKKKLKKIKIDESIFINGKLEEELQNKYLLLSAYHDYIYLKYKEYNNKFLKVETSRYNFVKKYNYFEKDNSLLLYYYWNLGRIYKEKKRKNNLLFWIRTGVLKRKYEYSEFIQTKVLLRFEYWNEYYIKNHYLSSIYRLHNIIGLFNCNIKNKKKNVNILIIIKNKEFKSFNIYFIYKIFKIKKQKIDELEKFKIKLIDKLYILLNILLDIKINKKNIIKKFINIIWYNKNKIDKINKLKKKYKIKNGIISRFLYKKLQYRRKNNNILKNELGITAKKKKKMDSMELCAEKKQK